MTFEEIMETLRKVKANGKLVIFVGSGISKNSGMPTWGQLVREYAVRLNYAHMVLTTDDYIRVPQYFYCIDDSPNHEEYYRILRQCFDVPAKPNIINQLISDLRPTHIITTNYDKLQEETRHNYEIITSDKDLLRGVGGKHYIVKMHGDIDDLEHIVVKEDDYLQYNHTHRLLEVFLQSLLIDHTFLFVGYSLNDYNLKTFISWIDYLGETMEVRQDMHKNFLVTDSITEEEDYLNAYYNQKGIEVINLNRLPKELDEEARKVPLKDPIGQKTYVVLKELKTRIRENDAATLEKKNA